MIVPQKMLVEVRDQTAWEVHDALLFCSRSGFEDTTKLEVCDGGLPASLSMLSQQSEKRAEEACTATRGTRHGKSGSTIQVLAVRPMRGRGEKQGELLRRIKVVKIEERD